MYRKIEDFVSDWNAEMESTIKIFSVVTDSVKSHRVNDDIRSLERLAWHITQTLTEMPFRAGVLEADFLEGKPIPDSMDEVIEIYRKYSNKLTAVISEIWTDDQLGDFTEIYGEQWLKKKILDVLVKHQIHHRGQMTALLRVQNVAVPGIYGPSKEEWVQYGMEPHV